MDLGCGPGNSTELVQRHFTNAVVYGMDSSPEMIEAARARLPDVRFEVADIATWHSIDAPFDIIFANAALQWVQQHEVVVPALLRQLASGGHLAVQIPDNLQEPAHQLMREVATDGPWASKLKSAPRAMDSRHSADWYYQTLRGHGARVDIWRTTYYHQLAGGAKAIVEWFKGTALRPFIQPLSEDERLEFLKRYETAISKAYAVGPDGTVLLPFPRLFFVAER
jgi:trans-aconitate 2-methyltransferase